MVLEIIITEKPEQVENKKPLVIIPPVAIQTVYNVFVSNNKKEGKKK